MDTLLSSSLLPWLFIVSEAVAIVVLAVKPHAVNRDYEDAVESLRRLLDEKAGR